MGLLDFILRGTGGFFIEDVVEDFIGEQVTQAIIEPAIINAIAAMESLPANEGQQSIVDRYFVPAFQNLETEDPEQCLLELESFWGEFASYIEFTGEILNVGIEIVERACFRAISAQEAIDFFV